MLCIFVLTMLAVGFAYSMKVELRLAKNSSSEAEIEWLGRSGVEYARWVLAQQLSIPQESYDALNQVWAGGSGGIGSTNSTLADIHLPAEVKLGNGSFTLQPIVDLERKFNINTADENLLQQALTHIGMDAGETTPVIGSILNWTAFGNNIHHLQGANSDYYHSMDPPYEAKNGPIDDVTELFFIRGITPELYWGGAYSNHTEANFQRRANRFAAPQDMPVFNSGLVDLFTPISSGRINLNTCSAEVLEIIPPGIDPLIAEAIVGARGGEDDGTGLTGPYRSVDQVSRVPEVGQIGPIIAILRQYCDVRSRTFQVQVDATVAGYTRHFTAILGRNNARDIQILSFYWK